MMFGTSNLSVVLIAGVMCMVAGAMGALPGNMVMSFACTARKLGVPVRRSKFGIILVFFSLLFFIFGDVLIAFLPKMIPGIVLTWLGIEFCAFWMFDLVGSLPFHEHMVVFLMTFVDLFIDTGAMVVSPDSIRFAIPHQPIRGMWNVNMFRKSLAAGL